MQYMRQGTTRGRMSREELEYELNRIELEKQTLQNMKYFAVMTAGMALATACWLFCLWI